VTVQGETTGVIPHKAGRVPPPCGIIDARHDFHPYPVLCDLPATIARPRPMTERLQQDLVYMALAVSAARTAGEQGEVPVGAVVVRDGLVIATAGNAMVAQRDATAHAEVLSIRAAQQVVNDARLTGCTLYVTLEPCAMCAGAIVLARVDRVVFGAWDDKAGMGGSVGDLLRHPRLNHRPEVAGGVMDAACGELLREWFSRRRTP